MGKYYHAAIVICFFILLYCLFFSPVLFSDRILAIDDALSLYLPSFLSPVSLWEPALQGGFPVAADLQNASWYPIARLFSLFRFWNGFVISAYVLMSCFCYAYVYFLTKSWVGAAVSGIVFGMSGFAMAHLPHTIIIHGMVWTPLILLAIEKVKLEGSAIWFVIGAFAIAFSLLSGHPQIPTYGLLVAIFYALTIVIFGFDKPLRLITKYAGMFIAGSALTAIQMIPLYELVSQSIREQPDFRFFLSLSLRPLNLTTLVFPALFGTPDTSLYSYPYFGAINFSEKTAYVGLITMLLCCVGLQRHKEKRHVWFWVSILIISVVLALGDRLPLARLLFFIPGLNSFRVPSRHLFELTLALTFLAGFGAAAIHQKHARQKTILWSVISCATIFIIATVAIWLNSDKIANMALRKGVMDFTLSPRANLAMAIPIVLFLIASLVVIFYARNPSTFRASILLGVLIFDISSLGFYCRWKLAPEKTVLHLPHSLMDLPQKLQKTHQRFLPVLGVWAHPDEGKPNLTRLWHIPNGSGYGSLVLKRISELLSMPIEGSLQGNWIAAQNRSLDLMAVRYLSMRKENNEDDNAKGNRWRLVRQFGTSLILENRHALPRAWIVSKVMKAPAIAVRHAILHSKQPDGIKFKPEEIALVEENFQFEGKDDPEAKVQITKLEKTVMEIHVKTAHPAFLVVSDTFYPGWTAKVNDTVTHLYRTNYLFRGVVVPSGFSTVHMKFDPASFRLGLAITVASSLLLLCITGWTMRKRARTDSNGRPSA